MLSKPVEKTTHVSLVPDFTPGPSSGVRATPSRDRQDPPNPGLICMRIVLTKNRCTGGYLTLVGCVFSCSSSPFSFFLLFGYPPFESFVMSLEESDDLNIPDAAPVDHVLEASALPKFDMHLYKSSLNESHVRILVKLYGNPKELHPRVIPEGLASIMYQTLPSYERLLSPFAVHLSVLYTLQDSSSAWHRKGDHLAPPAGRLEDIPSKIGDMMVAEVPCQKGAGKEGRCKKRQVRVGPPVPPDSEHVSSLTPLNQAKPLEALANEEHASPPLSVGHIDTLRDQIDEHATPPRLNEGGKGNADASHAIEGHGDNEGGLSRLQTHPSPAHHSGRRLDILKEPAPANIVLDVEASYSACRFGNLPFTPQWDLTDSSRMDNSREDIANITRKRPKPNKNGHENGKITQEPRIIKKSQPNSYFPNNSSATISRRRNKRRTPNVVEPELRTILEMANNRTMEELLQAPTEGGCPHHEFMELAQIDTFYNGLNDNDQDSLNVAAGRNLLSKTTREALQIIENKSKVRYSRNKPNVSRMNTTSKENASKSDDRIDKFADQISTLVDIFAKKVVTPVPVKAVEESCVTCGGNHAYYNCPNTDSNQPSVCVATGTYNQVALQNRASNFMAPPGFAPVQKGQNRFNQN
uniref:Reverse transcriptase domain-containing protein n=1 Tax=Tanacetum cinerariifolium TaxID=118510 RepID=A0A6L2N6S3_TANCI|nr:hypothetical protein [Tanacetum cinerariifolium]